jgi:hypothetical protein
MPRRTVADDRWLPGLTGFRTRGLESMTSPMRIGRMTSAALFTCLALAGCGSSGATPSHVAIAAVASPTASPDPMPTPTPAETMSPAVSLEPTPATPTAVPPLPATAPGIDGVIRPAALAFRTPLAVLIDDNAAARPQAGFNAAALVYQAPADGGETRYMFIFQGDEAKTIGPVRSGRPFFVRWAAEYRTGLAHYGGDYMTLGETIPQLDGKYIFDIDALRGSSAAFHRVKARSAPHNAYTKTTSLRSVGLRHGMPAMQSAGLDSRAYVDDTPFAERPASAKVSVPYPRGSAGYAYDRGRNLYLRSVAGKAQIDAGDGKRVTARNVVVLFMHKSIDPHSEPGHARIVLDQIGSGPALVFREGRSWKATWRKASVGDLTRFYGPDGVEIPLVRGRTFFQIVPTGTKVTY